MPRAKFIKGVEVTGSLPAFAATPSVKVDQTTPGTTNGVSQTSRKARVVRHRQNYTTVVNAAASTQVTITAAAGYKAKILAVGVYCPAPTGAASGTHKVVIGIGTETTYTAELFYASGDIAFGSAVQRNVLTSDTLFKGLEFSESLPLSIAYTNNTNVATSVGDSRFIYVLYEEEAIV